MRLPKNSVKSNKKEDDWNRTLKAHEKWIPVLRLKIVVEVRLELAVLYKIFLER